MEENKKTDQPLVSVAVITYNSSGTVLETLESVKNQSYQNIELIISDDCSPDDTVAVCERWVNENSDRFVRTEIITVLENTGTSANINRAVKACYGEFVKPIAGDDLLEPSCVCVNLENIDDATLAVSEMTHFIGNQLLSSGNNINFISALCKLAPQKRTKLYCRTFTFFNPPSLFIRRDLFDSIGYYEENSKQLEDVPFLIKLFNSNNKLIFISQRTVRYRMSGISHDTSRRLKIEKLLIDAFYNYARGYLNIFNLIDFIVIIERRVDLLAIKNNNQFLLRLLVSRYNFLRIIRLYLIKTELKRDLK